MDAVDDSKGKGFKERSIAVGKQAALQKQLQELKRSHQVSPSHVCTSHLMQPIACGLLFHCAGCHTLGMLINWHTPWHKSESALPADEENYCLHVGSFQAA